MKTASPHSRGFTLVEILVSLGIIAILSVLIASGVQKSASSSKQAACVGHLRTLITSWNAYCNDHNGQSFPYGVTAEYPIQTSWGYKLLPYLDDASGKVFSCPSASLPPASSSGPGSANTYYKAWMGVATGYRNAGYGLNAAWYSDPEVFGASSALAEAKYYRRSILGKSNEGPVFADATWENFRRADPVPSNFVNPGTYTCAIARHGKGINMAFADGSVRFATMGDLYSEIKLQPSEVIDPAWKTQVPARYR